MAANFVEQEELFPSEEQTAVQETQAAAEPAQPAAVTEPVDDLPEKYKNGLWRTY